ncbi:precorrin-6y C5,15-methyltransferase (decarboxylating) subunit CbiE [Metasolibacillus meyeri]|uniref:Precorrin-6y C5,15-methyltransferase (Decarboxylating) subunit CbiE n=1 Tax=Metasolibacillus meyeri TaxID=1071052 RepID=A0AAW9NI57_9BACL|nr:precorrin-6y C5,15-methyltransferase (decarboxylating) subunit CbiE [Metasolibacillus meyeri]MEC1177105.1 precorrin-6y C5,15-methyltransferase (decarboxylating) subunit CbiE [Metasolibacillus meyeri]
MKMIGIGDSVEGLLPQYKKWIETCEVLVGGERVLDFFPDVQAEKVVIKGGLSALVTRLQSETREVVVLASGDPLFYGIGSYLAKKLPLEIYPYMSSVQLAFSKMKDSWQDAYIVSVHGRSMKGLAQKIDGRPKVALLTDEENSPNAIARYLKEFGMHEYEAFVAENLGGETEKYGFYTLDELEAATFSPLNVVILRQTVTPKTYTLGIDDEEFAQRKPEKGLITKKEIRTLSIQALALHEKSIMWDIGTCTGSVAIEAGKIAREGAIYAVEKNEGDLENCLQNQRKFRVDFTAIHSKAPAGLEDFPSPDAIFIGGSGGEMQELLALCVEKLKADGRLVMNIATIENLYEAVTALKQNGCQVEILQAQLSRSKPILNMTRFVPLNPIYIVTARKGV